MKTAKGYNLVKQIFSYCSLLSLCFLSTQQKYRKYPLIPFDSSFREISHSFHLTEKLFLLFEKKVSSYALFASNKCWQHCQLRILFFLLFSLPSSKCTMKNNDETERKPIIIIISDEIMTKVTAVCRSISLSVVFFSGNIKTSESWNHESWMREKVLISIHIFC